MPIPCYFGGFICFFWAFSLPLLWIEKRFFKTIWLYPHRVTKFGGQNCRYLKTLSGFFWVEEKEYFVLHLVRKRGFAAHYGVPDTVTRDQIETLLFEAGLVKTLLETVHP